MVARAESPSAGSLHGRSIFFAKVLCVVSTLHTCVTKGKLQEKVRAVIFEACNCCLVFFAMETFQLLFIPPLALVQEHKLPRKLSQKFSVRVHKLPVPHECAQRMAKTRSQSPANFQIVDPLKKKTEATNVKNK